MTKDDPESLGDCLWSPERRVGMVGLLSLVAKWRVVERYPRRSLHGGALVAFIGGLLYIFSPQARDGVSLVITTAGFNIIIVVVVAALLAIWSVVDRGEPRAASTPNVLHSH